jgi:DNA-binding PucR family transcriptional regulator
MNPDDNPNNQTQSPNLAPLIDALKADPAKSAYYLDLLKPLQQYDTEHHGDLLKTLQAYLRHGGNSNQTADALFMHRNSLRYRLARIRAITTLDLDDPDSRLTLQVAILLLTS